MREPTWVTRRDRTEQFDQMPPRRNDSITSVEVWLALSDRTVRRGEVMYVSGEGARNIRQVHGWYLSSDDSGSPHRVLEQTPSLWVCGWALIEVPEHPFLRRRVL